MQISHLVELSFKLQNSGDTCVHICACTRFGFTSGAKLTPRQVVTSKSSCQQILKLKNKEKEKKGRGQTANKQIGSVLRKMEMTQNFPVTELEAKSGCLCLPICLEVL